jgi:Ca-activated chloride channel homolog
MIFLLALTVLILALARPSAKVTLPIKRQTVILAMDISGSMRATDVEPTRIAAAQAAAKAFVADQPRGTRIGVVTFAGTAALAQAPTENREDILAAIDRFQLQRATAIGSGILVSLNAIFPDAEFDLRTFNPRRDSLRSAPIDQVRDPQKPAPKPVPPAPTRRPSSSC